MAGLLCWSCQVSNQSRVLTRKELSRQQMCFLPLIITVSPLLPFLWLASAFSTKCIWVEWYICTLCSEHFTRVLCRKQNCCWLHQKVDTYSRDWCKSGADWICMEAGQIECRRDVFNEYISIFRRLNASCWHIKYQNMNQKYYKAAQWAAD